MRASVCDCCVIKSHPLLQSETRSETSEHHTGTENVQEAAVSEDR